MKKAILLSGGYDSVACLVLQFNSNLDNYIFFDYGQSYLKEELKAIKYLENELKVEVKKIKVNWTTDIKNRNFMMISRVCELGYDEIILGTRNILPIFDKYKDSNWLSLKLYGLLLRIKITMPVVLKSKKSVIKIITDSLLDISKLYSTEKKK